MGQASSYPEDTPVSSAYSVASDSGIESAPRRRPETTPTLTRSARAWKKWNYAEQSAGSSAQAGGRSERKLDRDEDLGEDLHLDLHQASAATKAREADFFAFAKGLLSTRRPHQPGVPMLFQEHHTFAPDTLNIEMARLISVVYEAVHNGKKPQSCHQLPKRLNFARDAVSSLRSLATGAYGEVIQHCYTSDMNTDDENVACHFVLKRFAHTHAHNDESHFAPLTQAIREFGMQTAVWHILPHNVPRPYFVALCGDDGAGTVAASMLVMDKLPHGGTLQQFIARLRQAARHVDYDAPPLYHSGDIPLIASKLWKLLSTLHSHGYAHFDLHTGNIWIETYPASHRIVDVHLLDFGFVQAAGRSSFSLDQMIAQDALHYKLAMAQLDHALDFSRLIDHRLDIKAQRRSHKAAFEKAKERYQKIQTMYNVINQVRMIAGKRAYKIPASQNPRKRKLIIRSDINDRLQRRFAADDAEFRLSNFRLPDAFYSTLDSHPLAFKFVQSRWNSVNASTKANDLFVWTLESDRFDLLDLDNISYIAPLLSGTTIPGFLTHNESRGSRLAQLPLPRKYPEREHDVAENDHGIQFIAVNSGYMQPVFTWKAVLEE